MTGTGNLPKFEEDVYRTREGLYLIPTAEVPLTNMHANEILNLGELPKKYCGFTECYRTEAGRHGSETRGIFRLHQFEKVEMVMIVHPDKSWEALEDMRSRAEKLLELLDIPYRVLILATEDSGFASAKTYDIECYAAADKRYLEVSSCSNCTDFQARRMNTRLRTNQGNIVVHTLNGSGLALPRLMISILENYQNADGSITIPKLLQPYMGGQKKITKK
jgi:seryl-tRNA synthetase